MRYALALALLQVVCSAAELRFAIFGDRTGGADQKVYEQVWSETARDHPAFVINVGDTIEGLHDETARSEWQQLRPIWAKYARIPLYFTPGNHDIWSALSEKLYTQESKHAASYSFTFQGRVHITVLDNGRTNALSDEQLQFLEKDMKTAPSGIPRLVFFHVPFWIVPVSFGSGAFDLHRIAKQYGIAAVISGHGHQFVMLQREGVQYLEVGSSGASMKRGLNSGLGAADGWFYGWMACTVDGMKVKFESRKLPDIYQPRTPAER